MAEDNKRHDPEVGDVFYLEHSEAVFVVVAKGETGFDYLWLSGQNIEVRHSVSRFVDGWYKMI